MQPTTLHITCPGCQLVSSAPKDTVVACPACAQHMYIEGPNVTEFFNEVKASTKKVMEISDQLPNMCAYEIAKALQDNRQDPKTAIAALLGGSRNFTPDGWAAYQVNSNDVYPDDDPNDVHVATPPRVNRDMGFDNSLGLWNSDEHTKLQKEKEQRNQSAYPIITPDRVSEDLVVYSPFAAEGVLNFLTNKSGEAQSVKEEQEQEAIEQRIAEFQRGRNMGFDDELGN